MKKIKNILKITTVFLFFVSLTIVSGCDSEQENTLGEYTLFQIYDVNSDATKVSSYECEIQTKDTKEQLELLFIKLMEQPQNTNEQPAVTDEMELKTFSLKNSRLTLNFGSGYKKMPPAREVLARAAIVRTLTQIEGIDYVAFTVDGSVLLNVSGTPVGIMTADNFIDNPGKEINTYEKANLTLYFADEKGENLKVCTKSDIVYSSNISMEKLVVENVISGPVDEDKCYPTINPDTKIISVTVKDTVCYVNLDSNFLTQVYDVSNDVAIYSLVNSLVELSNVNKVQISIDGKTDMSFQESIPLNTVFERNLEIIK